MSSDIPQSLNAPTSSNRITAIDPAYEYEWKMKMYLSSPKDWIHRRALKYEIQTRPHIHSLLMPKEKNKLLLDYAHVSNADMQMSVMKPAQLPYGYCSTIARDVSSSTIKNATVP